MVFGHRLPEDCYPVESLGERIDVESFHENTSEDLEWFLNHVRSRIEAYAERNGLVLACGPAPFLKAVQGFALAAKAAASPRRRKSGPSEKRPERPCRHAPMVPCSGPIRSPWRLSHGSLHRTTFFLP